MKLTDQQRRTRITNLSEAVGKTVAAVTTPDSAGLGFGFTDGSWLYAAAGCDCTCQEEPYVLAWDDRIPHADLRSLGLITEVEFEAEQKQAVALKEAFERAHYQQLKAKFEGQGQGRD